MSTNCPLCNQPLRTNHYKDLVCNCTGPVLDLKALLKIGFTKRLADLKSRLPVTVVVVDGFNTVPRCDQLKILSFHWIPVLAQFKTLIYDVAELEKTLTILDNERYEYKILFHA